MLYFRLCDNSVVIYTTLSTKIQDHPRLSFIVIPFIQLLWCCALLYLSLFSLHKSHVLFQRDITKWPCDNKCLFSPNLTTKHTQQQRARLGWDPACRGDWSVILPGSARPDCVDLDLGYIGLISKVSWVSFLRGDSYPTPVHNGQSCNPKTTDYKWNSWYPGTLEKSCQELSQVQWELQGVFLESYCLGCHKSQLWIYWWGGWRKSW